MWTNFMIVASRTDWTERIHNVERQFLFSYRKVYVFCVSHNIVIYLMKRKKEERKEEKTTQMKLIKSKWICARSE